MRLLLLYFTLFFFGLFMEGSGMEKETLVKEYPEDKVTAEVQAYSGLPGFAAQRERLKAYVLMLKALSPVKQFDLPVDNSKCWNHLSYRVLHSVSKVELTGCTQTLSSSRFMRLLSARHINGFYIYSLRELII